MNANYALAQLRSSNNVDFEKMEVGDSPQHTFALLYDKEFLLKTANNI